VSDVIDRCEAETTSGLRARRRTEARGGPAWKGIESNLERQANGRVVGLRLGAAADPSV
jgi:hypothetical protein